ncbi:MAG: hypothetical protein IJX38_02590 [Clostridia bacterium]|nr:hypothetical protein [Clostridia bacterium]
MAKRFRNTLYMNTKIKLINGHFCAIRNDDGTLFSGEFKTKIHPEELPEWYLFGRYYNRCGYMSTRGIVDMVYRPSANYNHFLKDDFLYVSYKDKIRRVTKDNAGSTRVFYDHYEGYDQIVCGKEIIDILKGAREYSGYDITQLIEQIREKEKWLRKMFPKQFGYDQWKYDVDEDFANGISDYARKRSYETI